MGRTLRIRHTCVAAVLAAELFAQTGTIRPVPKWRLGDKRQVEVNVDTRIAMDTLKLTMSSSATYQLEVVRARKDGYELMVRSEEMEMPSMGLASGGNPSLDSANQFLGLWTKAIYEPLARFEFRYRLDRAGTVIGLVNGKDDKQKLTAAMSQAVENALVVLPRTSGDTLPSPAPGLVAHVVDSLYEAFLEVQMNGMNYFLKIYSTDFPLSGSLRQAVRVTDVQAPIKHDLPVLPGVLEAGLDKNDDTELVGRTITTYDQDALHAYMQSLPGAASDQCGDVFMDEECVERFDKHSGWLVGSTCATRLKLGRMTLNVTESTKLQAVE